MPEAARGDAMIQGGGTPGAQHHGFDQNDFDREDNGDAFDDNGFDKLLMV